MWRVTIRGLLAKKLRLLTTALAVMLGVAFMAGTLVLTDTMGKVFDDLFADVNAGTDAYVRGETVFESDFMPQFTHCIFIWRRALPHPGGVDRERAGRRGRGGS